MPPRATFVMPVRNAAATLTAAVESCLAQDERLLEVLLVLNGCTDASPEMASEFARRDERVRILESPADGNIVAALNAGWRAAKSERIFRMDADDVAHPARAREQADLLDQRPELAAVACGVTLIGSLGDGMQRYVNWVNQLSDELAISQQRFIECPVIHPSVAVRRKVLEDLGGYREMPWAEDHDLWLRVLESGGLIGKSPNVLLGWHDGSDRLTRRDPRYGIDRTWRMKAHFIARLPQVREHGIALAGAGPIGKTLARHLLGEGIQVHGFFDVHPRRIGGRAAGLPVITAEDIGRCWREAVLISCVGVPGARDQVRAVAAAAGYYEGDDFWCAC